MKRIPRMTDKEDSQMRAVPQVKKKGRVVQDRSGKKVQNIIYKN